MFEKIAPVEHPVITPRAAYLSSRNMTNGGMLSAWTKGKLLPHPLDGKVENEKSSLIALGDRRLVDWVKYFHFLMSWKSQFSLWRWSSRALTVEQRRGEKYIQAMRRNSAGNGKKKKKQSRREHSTSVKVNENIFCWMSVSFYSLFLFGKHFWSLRGEQCLFISETSCTSLHKLVSILREPAGGRSRFWNIKFARVQTS